MMPRRRLVIFLLIYLVLLGLSHGVRYRQPDPYHAPAHLNTVDLARLDRDLNIDHDGPAVSIRYMDTGAKTDRPLPVIVLIHGSPAPASAVMDGLVKALAPAGRVIAPDLPGFGYSSRRIADYGFRSHAAYLKQFFDRLDLPAVHLVAYSMGGGVAIRLAAEMPEKVASLTLISSVGVQELELLGDYHLNHMVHAVQLAVVWMVQELTPHMGVLDRTFLNRQYARNFFDADQRPLRGLLQDIEMPTLILHGAQDGFVLPAAAREHARLVPQSALTFLDGGHLVVFQKTEWVAARIHRFLNAVATGRSPSRQSADPKRAAAAQDPTMQVHLEPAHGLLLLFYILLIALATLVSEDLACIGAGLMAARGIIGIVPAIGASLAGIVVGDLLLFGIGRVVGRRAVHQVPIRWFVKPEDVDLAASWFNQKGPRIIIASRFLPGSRLPTYVTAGILGTRPAVFLFYFCIAALAWTPLLVWLAMRMGQSLLDYYAVFKDYALLVVLGILGLFFGISRILVPLLSYRGRRLLLGKYRRLRHWEFWPIPVVYAPIALYVVLQGIVRRHLTLFTAANPGMPAGGIVGESKSTILRHLRPSGAVPPYIRLPSHMLESERVEQVDAFMTANSLEFPLVLKPDRGERGKDVAIVTAAQQMREYFSRVRSDTIVQPYIAGKEYGIFYIRYPGHDQATIFSITDKRPITVTGDGARTLERLILDDPRAVCKAPLHLYVHRKSLYRIPAQGEVVPLVTVGTHARGALFLDANHLATDALARAMDAISRHFNGFYFGRYDVRVPSEEALKAGRDITVLELNGVTSEATHIYDPGFPLLRGLGVLMQQWKTAIEIGQINHRNGAHTLSVWAFLRLVRTGGQT